MVVIGFILRYVHNSVENYYLSTRIYNIVEYTCLAYFFSLQLKNRFMKKALLFSLVPFLALCIYDYAVATKPSIPFAPLSCEYIVLLFFIIYFFFEVMQEVVVEPIYQRSIFWISVAFIVNFSGNFILFLYAFSSSFEVFGTPQYTIIYSTVTLIKNLLLCISALIVDKHSATTSPSIDTGLNDFNPFQNQNL